MTKKEIKVLENELNHLQKLADYSWNNYNEDKDDREEQDWIKYSNETLLILRLCQKLGLEKVDCVEGRWIIEDEQ